ncbi:MAG: type II secretion system protein [Armatimonadetes bacterium]|nr:type II secretion system protein [Armatimonadota bacterium]
MKLRAFSLVELLVVISIIGILAGLTFSVFSRAKDQAKRATDAAQMAQIHQALQLYRYDQEAYPPALLGYASLYTSDGSVVPAEKVRGFLYPKRIGGIGDMKPSMVSSASNAYTSAVWPNIDPTPLGPGEDANHRQKYGPGVTVSRILRRTDIDIDSALGINENINSEGSGSGDRTITSWFYNVDGYDIGKVRLPGNGTRIEIHYAPFWTGWGLTSGNANDDPRQLGYSSPPDNTIITWDSYFREYTGDGDTLRERRDYVLTLSGSVKLIDSLEISNKSFRAIP